MQRTVRLAPPLMAPLAGNLLFKDAAKSLPKRTISPSDHGGNVLPVRWLCPFPRHSRKTTSDTRTGSHTPPGNGRSNGTIPGRGRSARDVEGDRFPPQRENDLKKRAQAEGRQTKRDDQEDGKGCFSQDLSSFRASFARRRPFGEGRRSFSKPRYPRPSGERRATDSHTPSP